MSFCSAQFINLVCAIFEKMNNSFFAPQLFIPNGIKDLDFYKKAFGATEVFRFANDDGSIHVAELAIGVALFHVHEVTKDGFFTPEEHKGTTVIVGLFVEDVHAVMASAVAAGAVEISPATDYDYGYRQGEIRDPFGHIWLIQRKIAGFGL